MKKKKFFAGFVIWALEALPNDEVCGGFSDGVCSLLACSLLLPALSPTTVKQTQRVLFGICMVCTSLPEMGGGSWFRCSLSAVWCVDVRVVLEVGEKEREIRSEKAFFP